ncbi:MAG: prepilin-type N-terminal cleavage/methylation domain-containing protein [Bdellovibrionota bacterium]
MISRSQRRQRGFTLVEVLVAMVIMIGGVIVVANAWSGNFSRVRSARINNVAATLLERKMTEIEFEYAEKTIDELKDEDAGDFGAMYPGYTWEMKSQEFEMPDLSGAMTSQDGGADETLLMIMRTTAEFFKKSVKEVCVTVIYKPRAGNPIRHTVTTFLVDYTKELPMPGLGGG